MKKICIIGDSITYGSLGSDGIGWADRLCNYYEDIDDCIETYNLGISCNTTVDLLKRIDCECDARKPDIIIFAIGINDARYKSSPESPNIARKDFERNLTELIHISKKYTEKIVFIGLTRVDEKKTMPAVWLDNTFYKNSVIEEYDERVKRIAGENKLLYIDVQDCLSTEDDFIDGLHPNDSGHKKLFEIIKNSLNEMI